MERVTRCQKLSLLCGAGTEATLALPGHGSYHHHHLHQNAHPWFPGRCGLPVVGCIPEGLGKDSGRGSEIRVATWPQGPFSWTLSWGLTGDTWCQGMLTGLLPSSLSSVGPGSTLSFSTRFPVTLTWKGAKTILTQAECSVSSHRCSTGSAPLWGARANAPFLPSPFKAL